MSSWQSKCSLEDANTRLFPAVHCGWDGDRVAHRKRHFSDFLVGRNHFGRTGLRSAARCRHSVTASLLYTALSSQKTICLESPLNCSRLRKLKTPFVRERQRDGSLRGDADERRRRGIHFALRAQEKTASALSVSTRSPPLTTRPCAGG